MPTIERSVAVQQPVEKVWEFLSDFTTTEAWDPGTVSCERVSGDGGVGTVYRNVSRFMGREVEIEYTAVEVVPGREFRLHGRTDAMEMEDTIRFHAEGDRTRVDYIARFEPQGLTKLVTPLMAPFFKKLGDDAAESLERTLSRL
ncbi:MAG: SRPBCC family protein [Nocardioidaceae bacterium]|nr:SRPBCC family protein [Nocardioidaceae bacterium]